MSVGTGIAIAGIWIATACVVAVFNTRLGNTTDGMSPFAAVVLAGIACGATYYVAVGR